MATSDLLRMNLTTEAIAEDSIILRSLALHLISFLVRSVLKAERLHFVQSKNPSSHHDLGGCPREAPPCSMCPTSSPTFVYRPPHSAGNLPLFLFFAGRLCPKIPACFSSLLLSGLCSNNTFSERPSPKPWKLSLSRRLSPLQFSSQILSTPDTLRTYVPVPIRL